MAQDDIMDKISDYAQTAPIYLNVAIAIAKMVVEVIKMMQREGVTQERIDGLMNINNPLAFFPCLKEMCSGDVCVADKIIEDCKAGGCKPV